LIAEGAKRRCLVPVALIAADERIVRYRHPLPTQRSLLSPKTDENCVHGYVMVAGGFLKEGLVASITRFKRVGDMPEGMTNAYARVCGVDAIMQEACVPGRTLGDVFSVCQRAYADMGFPADEWHNHHQGGTTGYAGRTCKAVPNDPFPILDERWRVGLREILGIDVVLGHAFAWNPSAVGVKSEDTFVLLPDGTQEIVTLTPRLPPVDLAKVLGRGTRVVKSGIAGA
jgi:antitoxin VapB